MAINNPQALLQRLLKEPVETEWLEFKHNNNNPDLIGEYVSACANSAMLLERDRAFIVFGIEDGTRRLVGTQVRLGTMKKGGEGFINWLSRQLSPRLMIEHADFQYNGMDFAILGIEPTYDRPVACSGVEWIRIGQHKKKLKDHPEHEKALWIATSRHTFESALALSHQSAEQIDELLDIGCYYTLSGQEIPRNSDEVFRRFVERGFLTEDMETGYHVTNLGAILFAKNIRDFPSISAKSVRVIKYAGYDKRSAEHEQEGVKGYAVGFSGLLKFIRRHLPRRESYPSGVRRQVPLYSETAIREIVANSLIHQDFLMTGVGPIVEIYEDRIEVTNPGRSLIEVDRIIDERRSRNERLAQRMRELNLCEERGGGIDKAIIDIEEKYLPAPEFIGSEHSMRVVVFGPKKFNELSKQDKIWSCFCHCVVRWLRNDYMSNSSLRQRFALPDNEYQIVSAVIFDTRKARKIVPAETNQSNKYARYVPWWAR
jgi:predicted HTH transcriptional regulator